MKHSWEPHLYFSSERYIGGQVQFSCDIKNSAEHPSECYLGLRDWSNVGGQYREGPSLLLKADGTLLAADRALAKVLLGRWIHIDIRFDQNQAGIATAPTIYRLAITPAGEKAQIFAHVPFLHRGFRQFTWFGFSSSGAPGAVFYVDNIRLEYVPPKN